MKLDLTILFVLALGLAIFSASQMVQSIKNIGQTGIVAIVMFGLLFVFSMFMLAFGMYATEDEKGKIKNRVRLFDRWLDKESK